MTKFRKRIVNFNNKKLIILQKNNSKKISKFDGSIATKKQNSTFRSILSISKSGIKTEILITIVDSTKQEMNYSEYIEFTNKIQRKLGNICKLKFSLKDKIMQGLNCSSLFHQDHIEFWLQNNNSCSVCNFILYDNYKKYF